MPFPLFRRPSVRPGQVQKPVLRKPISKPGTDFNSLSKISARPGQVQKPVLKSVAKPGFLAKGRFRKTDKLITELKKQSYYKKIPTYNKKLSQKERINLIKILQKTSGASGGLSDRRMEQAIKKLKKEKIQAGYRKQYKRIKELDQQIKQAKDWQKTWLSSK